MEKSVIVKNVTKKYKLYNKNSEKLLDLLLPKSYGEEYYALRNVSFEAEKGDVIGFVGVNGSGKSTLSNIIAGIAPATDGSVVTNGKTALIAVASGLNNQLTGKENIELKMLMLGFDKKQIRELEPEIIEFSELGKFINQPVKSYSSGMKSRLGFSISVHIDPDILIIDEALSEKGKTMFFVSHSIGQMKKFCSKALWLEYGEVKAYGTMKEVMPQYETFLKEYKAMSKKEQKKYREEQMEKRSQATV